MAARPRARRPALDADVHLRRQPALPGRHPGLPARGLGAPRHGSDRVPGREGVRAAPGDRAGSGCDRAAEALRAALSGGLGGPIRFRARLSSSLAWTVTVTRHGREGARDRHAAPGTRVDWTWDATGVPPGRYTWTIDGAGARSATGRRRRPARRSRSPAHAALTVISPDGDGRSDALTVSTGSARARSSPPRWSTRDRQARRRCSATARRGQLRARLAGLGLPDGATRSSCSRRAPNGTQAPRDAPGRPRPDARRARGSIRTTFSPNGDGAPTRWRSGSG